MLWHPRTRQRLCRQLPTQYPFSSLHHTTQAMTVSCLATPMQLSIRRVHTTAPPLPLLVVKLSPFYCTRSIPTPGLHRRRHDRGPLRGPQGVGGQAHHQGGDDRVGWGGAEGCGLGAGRSEGAKTPPLPQRQSVTTPSIQCFLSQPLCRLQQATSCLLNLHALHRPSPSRPSMTSRNFLEHTWASFDKAAPLSIYC